MDTLPIEMLITILEFVPDKMYISMTNKLFRKLCEDIYDKSIMVNNEDAYDVSKYYNGDNIYNVLDLIDVIDNCNCLNWWASKILIAVTGKESDILSVTSELVFRYIRLNKVNIYFGRLLKKLNVQPWAMDYYTEVIDTAFECKAYDAAKILLSHKNIKQCWGQSVFNRYGDSKNTMDEIDQIHNWYIKHGGLRLV
jgi:hypothetical protein